MMQKPTVGRQVHFYFAGSHEGTEQLAATICKVNDDGTVNLGVMREDGSAFGQFRVNLIPEGTPGRPLSACCVWPPPILK